MLDNEYAKYYRIGQLLAIKQANANIFKDYVPPMESRIVEETEAHADFSGVPFDDLNRKTNV